MNKIQTQHLTDASSNLRWAERNKNNLEIFESFSYSTNGHVVEIDATIEDYYNNVDVFVRQIGDHIQFECECRFCTPTSACGHVILSVELYNEFRFEQGYKNMLGNSFSDYKEEVLEDYRKQRENERFRREYEEKKQLGTNLLDVIHQTEFSQVNDVLNSDKYHLEFEISIETNEYGYYYDPRTSKSLRARVGNNKMYVIKDWTHFFDLIDNMEYFRYGKDLGFIHTLDAFDTESQESIKKLRTLYEKVNPSETRMTHFYLNGNTLDEIYDILVDVPKRNINLTMENEYRNIHLFVEELDNQEYQVSIGFEDEITVGKEYLYLIEKRLFNRVIFDPQGLHNFVKLMIEEEYVILSKRELEDLLQIINVSNNPQVILRGYTLQSTQKSNPSVYIDLEDNDIIINTEDIQDGQSLSIFDEEYKADMNATKIKYLIDSVGVMVKDTHYLSLDEESTYQFLREGISYLDGIATVYASESLRNIKEPSNVDINIGVSVDNGLLNIDIKSLKYSQDELDEILSQFSKRRKYFKLKSGEVINLDIPELEELEELSDSVGISTKKMLKGNVSLPLYRSLQIEDELLNMHSVNVDLSDYLVKFNENFKALKLDDIVIAPRFDEILKPYQKHGVRWMTLLAKYGFNGILADDMGLGKTLQVIALLEGQKSDKPSIVIAPASLLYNWEDELKKFDSPLKSLVIHGPKINRKKQIKEIANHDIVITTYDYMRLDYEEYEDINFGFIIIDEAQYIKNPKTQNARSVKTLNGEHRIALTGTPIENSLSELWSIFDFLMPGYLYTYTKFRRDYEIPIIKDEDEKKQEKLRKLVEPFILRRIKKDVLTDLPEKHEKVLRIEFSEDEEKLYLAKLAQGSKEVQQILNSDKPDNIMILKLLTELRQLCIDPRLLFEELSEPSSKMKASVELIQQFTESKQKTLLFSSFTRSLDLLEQELIKNNISYYKLTGSNTKEERRDLVEKFQNDDTSVFLISLKAAGVGLNLTAAENVIHFDPWWNVAAENQASDRAYRIGQENEVLVIKLIMKDSLEEKIVEMQNRKQEISDIFIEGSKGSFASLSRDDILDLFKQ